MTRLNPRPSSGRREGRQQQLNKANALRSLQQQAAAVPADPFLWWQQLLAEEAELQQRESIMTVRNVRWSHNFWADLHDRSERLANQMAACIQQMEAQR
jgi:hypothetical protein